MKLELLSLTLIFFLSSTLLGNISSIENNFQYSLFSSNQDTTSEDSISIVSKLSITREKFKSPGKAMLYSAVIPGMGQVYMGQWKRGLIYLALEGIAAGVWYQNNVLAEERKKQYASYEEDHWDFARWIKDYYKWYEYKEGDDNWNDVRNVFLDSDSTYKEIWDHGHSINFTWDGKIISSSQNQGDESDFTDKFDNLCGNGAYSNRECDNSIENITSVMKSNKVYVIKGHHYYEGIQKYDMFFAGWDDNDSVIVTDKGNNDKNATSPSKLTYGSIYDDYNNIKKLAGLGGKFMLINRFVSIIDGLFLAKKWNTEHHLKLNLDVYPDFRNKTGVGSVKLSIGWK